jgi:hypothetical protein
LLVPGLFGVDGEDAVGFGDAAGVVQSHVLDFGLAGGAAAAFFGGAGRVGGVLVGADGGG